MRPLFALVLALGLALGLGACIDFDARPPLDAAQPDSKGIDAALPDGPDAAMDAPPTADATNPVEQ
jgi:hypothetical protein